MTELNRLWFQMGLALSAYVGGGIYVAIAVAHDPAALPVVIIADGLAVAALAVGGVVVYAILNRRLRTLKSRFPKSLITAIAQREETKRVLLRPNLYSSAGMFVWFLEASEDGIRVWRSLPTLELVARIPSDTIVGVTSSPGRITIHNVAWANVRVNTSRGPLDIPFLPTGDGLRVLAILRPEKVPALAIAIAAKVLSK